MFGCRRIRSALALAVLAGCAARSQPAQVSAASSQVEGTKPTPVASSITETPAQKCLATVIKQRPATGWVVAGTITAAARADNASSDVIFRDANGRESKAVALGARGVLELACASGGYLLVPEAGSDDPFVRVIRGVLLRPEVESEPGDLTLLCAPLTGARTLNGRLLRGEVADAYEQRLTTRRWRAWIAAVEEIGGIYLGGDGDDPGKEAVWQAKAAELDAAARKAGIASCWLASAMSGR
jgi:hypothetical protein